MAPAAPDAAAAADGGGRAGGGGSPAPPRSPVARQTSLLSDFLEAKGALPDEDGMVCLPPPTDLRPRVDKLPLLTKIAYGAPSLATSSLSFLVSVYLNDFYLSLGAPLAFLTFFIAVARSMDILVDPTIGNWTDGTRTRWGRRRVFTASGCLFYGLFFFLLFSPPEAVILGSKTKLAPGEDIRPASGAHMPIVLWFGFFYWLFYLTDSFSNVPYEALGPELTDSEAERNNLFFISKLFNMAGMLLGAALPSILQGLIRRAGSVSGIKAYCPALVSGARPVPTGGIRLAPPPYLGTGGDGVAAGQCVPSAPCAGGAGKYCFRNAQGIHFETSIPSVLHSCTASLSAAMGPAPPPPPPCGSVVVGPAAPCPFAAECVNFTGYKLSALAANRAAFAALAGGFGLYYILSVAVMVWRVKERPLLGEAANRVPLVPSFMRAFKNIAFRPLLVAWALEALGMSSLTTMAPFFIRYVVEADGPAAAEKGRAMDPTSVLGAGSMLMLVVGMVSSAFWLAMVKKFGKWRIWILVSTIGALIPLLLFIPQTGNPYLTIALIAANGITISAGAFITSALLCECIDVDEFNNGSRSEGAFMVFATLLPKFVAIPASALPLTFINALGFVPPVQGVSQKQPARVRWFIQGAFIALPCLSALIALAFKLRFPVKTEAMSRAIQDGIAAHARGEAVPNPLVPGAPATHLLRLEGEEERRDVWRYECFSVRLLDELLRSGSPAVVVREMGMHLGLALFCVATALAFTGGTARWIAHPSLSILPVLGAICTGASLCYLAISVARLHAARELNAGDTSRHAGLIKRVRSVKAGGGRAGVPGEGGGRLLQETLSLSRIGSRAGSIVSGRWRPSTSGLSSRRSSTVGGGGGGGGTPILRGGTPGAGGLASQDEGATAAGKGGA